MFEGDPERKLVERSYMGHPMHSVNVDLYRTSFAVEQAQLPLENLVAVWTQPLRSPEHLRNWKFRLEREWPELHAAVTAVVEAVIATDPDYQAWLKDNAVRERKS
jgi:hypothetical protein